MRRRTIVCSAGGLAALAAAGARAADGEPWRVGWLGTSDSSQQQPLIDRFTRKIEARGYHVGRDLLLVPRLADNRLEALPALAHELVATQPAAIVAVGSSCAAALARQTRTVPIVALYLTSPVETGLVASLAKPGGNVTGSTANQAELAGKLLEVLKIADRRVVRVAILRNPDNLGIQAYSPHAAQTAQRLGMHLHYVELRRREDLQLDALDQIRPDALYVVNDFVVNGLLPQLLAYALERRIASIGIDRAFARSGGLLALGPDLDEMDGNIAEYVDRVLHGAAPALLPVREPSRYDLAVNRATARAIGLPLSQELLLRAQEVID
jgi:putative ABC transport system substrate-binding protein